MAPFIHGDQSGFDFGSRTKLKLDDDPASGIVQSGGGFPDGLPARFGIPGGQDMVPVFLRWVWTRWPFTFSK